MVEGTENVIFQKLVSSIINRKYKQSEFDLPR